MLLRQIDKTAGGLFVELWLFRPFAGSLWLVHPLADSEGEPAKGRKSQTPVRRLILTRVKPHALYLNLGSNSQNFCASSC